jgi:hypothetical protein
LAERSVFSRKPVAPASGHSAVALATLAASGALLQLLGASAATPIVVKTGSHMHQIGKLIVAAEEDEIAGIERIAATDWRRENGNGLLDTRPTRLEPRSYVPVAFSRPLRDNRQPALISLPG